MSNKPRILCDLDGCIVNFDSAACRAHGTTLEELNKHRMLVEWSIVRSMGLALGKELTIDEFYEPIHEQGEHFWMGLQLLPHAHELLALLDKYSDDWYIVTAPVRGTASYVGKVKWLKAFFGQQFDRFVITQHKELMANPNTILIDDHGKNTDKFVANKGVGIVFPTLGNILCDHARDPIAWVDQALRFYLDSYKE